MNPNPAIVRAFLTDIHDAAARACKDLPDPGVLQLVQIDPRTESTTCSRFKIGQVDEMTAAAIAAADAGFNCYVEPRTVKMDARGRGKGTDTIGVFAFVLDRDSDKGMAGAPFVEPTLQVDTSPGNSHDWLMLETALPYDAARALGDAIRLAVGADSDSGVPTQPYRIAGTPNFPSAAKIERGRVTCATTYRNGGPVWNQAQLSEAAGAVTVYTDNAPDIAPTGEIDATVEQLVSERVPVGQRSTRFAHAVKLAVERGMAIDDFEALCRANPRGCAQKYLPPKRNDLRKRIDEVWQPHAMEVAALVKSLFEYREKNSVFCRQARSSLAVSCRPTI